MQKIRILRDAVIITVSIALIGLIAAGCRSLMRIKRENVLIRREQMEYFKTLDNRNAALSEGFEVGLKELKEFMPQLSAEIESMKIKLERIETVQQIGIQTSLNVRTALKDTVVAARYLSDMVSSKPQQNGISNMRTGIKTGMRPNDEARQGGNNSPPEIKNPVAGEHSDSVAVKVFRYKDMYWNIEGVALSDSQLLRVSMCDTLIQVVHRGKREKPWLWIFSKRRLEQTVRLGNPNAQIKYSRVINVM